MLEWIRRNKKKAVVLGLLIIVIIGGLFWTQVLRGKGAPKPPAIAPVANFTATPASGQAPLEVEFDSSSSKGKGLTYEWNFGDGQTGTGKKIKHIFSNAGQFNVKLMVIDKAGRTAEKTGAINIKAPPAVNQPPVPPVTEKQIQDAYDAVEREISKTAR